MPLNHTLGTGNLSIAKDWQSRLAFIKHVVGFVLHWSESIYIFHVQMRLKRDQLKKSQIIVKCLF